VERLAENRPPFSAARGPIWGPNGWADLRSIKLSIITMPRISRYPPHIFFLLYGVTTRRSGKRQGLVLAGSESRHHGGGWWVGVKAARDEAREAEDNALSYKSTRRNPPLLISNRQNDTHTHTDHLHSRAHLTCGILWTINSLIRPSLTVITFGGGGACDRGGPRLSWSPTRKSPFSAWHQLGCLLCDEHHMWLP
jgi:hypothetical protein